WNPDSNILLTSANTTVSEASASPRIAIFCTFGGVNTFTSSTSPMRNSLDGRESTNLPGLRWTENQSSLQHIQLREKKKPKPCLSYGTFQREAGKPFSVSPRLPTTIRQYFLATVATSLSRWAQKYNYGMCRIGCGWRNGIANHDHILNSVPTIKRLLS